MSLHRWATEAEMVESDGAIYTRLRGTEWDRAAWRDIDLGSTGFSICPTCHCLVARETASGADGLLAHRNSPAHRGAGLF